MRTDNATVDTEAPAGMHSADQAPRPSPQYAVVELMGHARIAGLISEQVFGGATLMRIDVPAVIVTEHPWRNGGRAEVQRLIPAHTRSFGAAAIYSINWCDQAMASAAANSIKHEVLKPYSLLAALDGLAEGEQTHLLALTAGASTACTDDPWSSYDIPS